MEKHFLDITHLECPMTFVRAKLFLAGLAPGDLAQIRLNSGEALENLPTAVSEEGHQILGLAQEQSSPGAESAEGKHLLSVRVAVGSI